MVRIPDPDILALKTKQEGRERKRNEVIRLTEAIIAGGVDLSPEEMVDAAFLMVERIDEKIYGNKE